MIATRGREFAGRSREDDVGEPGPPRRNWKQRVFGVATEWTTYAALFYLLLSLPIAIASWTALVTLLAVGGGLAVTVIGIPLLVLTMYAWCFGADLERLFSNALLRTTIRPLPFGAEDGTRGAWPRLKARLRNRATWRALFYLLVVRLPLGVAGFAIVSSTVLYTLRLSLLPITTLMGAEEEILAWTVDTPSEAGLSAAIGLLLFVPALHVARWTGSAAAWVNTRCLQTPETAIPQPMGEALERAATAAVRWPGMFARTARMRERSLQLRVWGFHFGLYAAVMLVLLVIDATFTTGQWWVLWPAWGWGIAVALHTGYLLGGHLGGHALAWATTNLGLFVIDAQVAGSTWFFWPLVGWAIALAAHAYVYFGFAPVEAEPLLEAYEPGAAEPTSDSAR